LLHHLSLTFHPGFQGYDGLINLPRPGSAGWRIALALRPGGACKGTQKGLLTLFRP